MYYAEYCPYGRNTLSEANILKSFYKRRERDAYVEHVEKANAISAETAHRRFTTKDFDHSSTFDTYEVDVLDAVNYRDYLAYFPYYPAKTITKNACSPINAILELTLLDVDNADIVVASDDEIEVIAQMCDGTWALEVNCRR